MDWKLEVVVVPVSDIDRAKSFYADKAGFHVDFDRTAGAVDRNMHGVRIVQLTPSGSACSIVLMSTTRPDSDGRGTIGHLQLIVDDVEAARAELVERGVDVSEVRRLAPGDGGAFVFFADPDGNGWAVQEPRDKGRSRSPGGSLC